MNGYTKHELKESLKSYIEDAKQLQVLKEKAPSDLKYRIKYSLYSILFNCKTPLFESIEKIDAVFDDLRNCKLTDADIAISKLQEAGLPIPEEAEELIEL